MSTLTRADVEDLILDDRDNNRRLVLSERDLSGLRLGGLDLQGANLRGANLRGTNLRGANLRDANLQEANLWDANLRNADLRNADLQDADLRDADLRDADLRDADLQDADLSRSSLLAADLRNADLWRSSLKGADLRDANLRGANLLDVDLRDAYWGGLVIDRLPSGRVYLIPILDDWYMHVGCWEGTPDELRRLIAQDEGWPDAEGKEITRRRPYLEAVLALCEVHIANQADVIDDGLYEGWGRAPRHRL